MAKRGPRISRFVLNCLESRGTDGDWRFGDAADAGLVEAEAKPPTRKDLRQDWWKIQDQGKNGACVGFAIADGVLRWHYTKQKWIEQTDLLSPRFIWMANKETDDLTSYPTTFLESAGTTTKLGLDIARKYGSVFDHMLPMSGALSPLKPNVFFSIAAQFRITAYYNLGGDLDNWRRWIAESGPVLVRLDVDDTWKNATRTEGALAEYKPQRKFGGHAACLVGYTTKHFIVRNSWGTNWGDEGFGYATNAYAAAAFTEAYGVVL